MPKPKKPRKLDEAGRAKGGFGVDVLFWDDILPIYDRHQDVYELHYGLGGPMQPIHQIPAAPGDFAGRVGEIDTLLTWVRSGGVTISGVRGMGGIGKTALAFKLAEALRDQYPDAQLYLNLRGTAAGGPEAPPSERPMTACEAMGDLIHAFRPEEKLPEDLEHLQPFYLTVLNGRKALLLMDNAADADQVRPLIPPPGCVMLVTSRNHFALPGWKALDLAVLPEGDARELLLTIAERIGGEADPIAELCGYLPLALRAAASALAARADLDPAEFARRLGDERTRLEAIGTEGVDLSLAGSFNLSYQLLPGETRKVFAFLGVFPGTFDELAAETVCNDLGHRQVSQLVRRSLVEYEEVTRRYRVHDLVRLFASDQLNEAERREAQFRHAHHYNGVLALADRMYLRGGDGVIEGLGLFDRERHNIEAGQSWPAGQAKDDKQAAELCNEYAGSGTYCLGLRLDPRERIRWLETGLDAARGLGVRADEGVHLCNLGIAHVHLSEYRRAIGFFEQALAIAREVGRRAGEANVLGNLGNVYANLGEYPRAIEFYKKCLCIAREFGDKRGEEGALGNLGNAHAALGENRRAIDFYELALAIAREIGDACGEGNALSNLGNAYAALGEYRGGIEFDEQALAIARQIGDRQGEAHALGNLGNAHTTLGEYPRAIEFYEHRLAIMREMRDSMGEGCTLWHVAHTLWALGRKAEAIRCAEEALPILEAIGSPHANDVRTSLSEWRKEPL